MNRPKHPRLLAALIILGSIQTVSVPAASEDSPRHEQNAHVVITSSGYIKVDNRIIKLKQLKASLKKIKADPRETLIVAIPEQTPQKVLVTLSRELVKQGYSRFVFSKPVKATAEKGADPLLRRINP